MRTRRHQRRNEPEPPQAVRNAFRTHRIEEDVHANAHGNCDEAAPPIVTRLPSEQGGELGWQRLALDQLGWQRLPLVQGTLDGLMSELIFVRFFERPN